MPVSCFFGDVPHVEAYNLHLPGILHKMYITMFDDLMTRIDGFLQCHCQAAAFDDIWAGIPPYPSVYHCGDAYEQMMW